MRATERRVTYTELQSWPDDGRRYELYDGEVWVIPSPLLMHQDAAQNIFVLLRDYAASHGGKAIISPIDIVFDELNVLQPDVVFFSADRRELLRRDQPIRHAPDLVLEVLSPSTSRNDRGRKMQMFARFRMPEYWIADPVERTIEVWRLAAGRYDLATRGTPGDRVRSATLPFLEFDVDPVFAE